MMLKLLGILLLLTTLISGAFYWYYNDSQERMAILNANVATMDMAIQISEDTILSLEKSFSEIGEELTTVNEGFRFTREQNRRLSDKLGKHDIGYLAQNKPVLVERVINNATSNVGRCFEILAGAELTIKEMESKNGKAFNSECPWLFGTNYAN